VVLAANSYLERENLPFAEFYALLLFATAGMGVLASARELLTAFIGLELSSISSYILAGFRRDSTKSSEASLKYFLLGSFATAFFLYGIALCFGGEGFAKVLGFLVLHVWLSFFLAVGKGLSCILWSATYCRQAVNSLLFLR